MKCLLVSFFNSHNIGDCIIADTLYKFTSEEYDTEKYSYSGNPYTITDINNITATNEVRNTGRKKIIYELLKKAKLDLLISSYRLLNNNNTKVMKNDIESKIANVDLLVIGGGNMIFDLDKHSNSGEKFDNLVSIAKKNGTKVFAISLGIGPFYNERQEIKACEALKKCDYITFRDQKSYDIYAQHVKQLENVDISIDPVFFLPLKAQTIKKERKSIGVNFLNSNLINNNKKEYNNLIIEYTKLVERLRDELDVNVIMFSTDLSDYETIYQIYNQLSCKDGIIVKDINGFNELIDFYGNISLLVAMRMHAMIIAYTQHIPVIGLSWQPKVEAFFDIIESKDSVFEYKEIQNSLDSIIALSNSKLINLRNEKEKIMSTLDNIRTEKNIDRKILMKFSR